MLAENAALILDIFFAILIGLILGLTLLTSNLRGPIETTLVYLLLFCERKSMRALLKKNLMAHKATNKLTSIIYALTLGCVLFLCVSLNLVINSVTAVGLPTMPDSDIYISFQSDPYAYRQEEMISAGRIDLILNNYSDQIKDFALISRNFWA